MPFFKAPSTIVSFEKHQDWFLWHNLRNVASKVATMLLASAYMDEFEKNFKKLTSEIELKVYRIKLGVHYP